jgi:hypothetical protein
MGDQQKNLAVRKAGASSRTPSTRKDEKIFRCAAREEGESPFAGIIGLGNRKKGRKYE